MKHPPYPRYKPSGIEWLGDVPEHWDVGKLSREVHIAEGQVDPEVEPYASMLLVAPNHVEGRAGRLILRETASEQGAQSGKYLCRKGDVIYSKIRPSLAKVTMAPEDCLCSADMYALRSRGRFANRYVGWLLLSRSFTAWSVLEADRVAMPKINREALHQLRMPVPSTAEQEAIADFLDAQTATLDTLVAKKRTLIDRLNEKRAALISRTVTRGLPPEAARAAGLDPHPRLKPSGIDWLGDVPEHWWLTRLKHAVTTVEQGWSPDCQSRPPTTDEWGVVKAGCCNGGWFNPDESKALPPDLDPPRELMIKPGDVLMSRASGSNELIGSTAWVPAGTRAGLLLSDKTYRLRCKPGVVQPQFLAQVLQSSVGRRQIGAVISGAAGLAKNITQVEVRGFTIPLSTLSEQVAIVDYLDSGTARIDHMVAKIQAAIDRLQEYRAALITAAVTGKIDVRPAVV